MTQPRDNGSGAPGTLSAGRPRRRRSSFDPGQRVLNVRHGLLDLAAGRRPDAARRASPKMSRIATGRSFTLIEVLLALTLAGTVLTLAAQIAGRTLRSQCAVTDLLEEQARYDFVGDSIAADLGSRMPDGASTLSILLDAHHRPLIQIHCLAAEPGGGLHVSRLPANVQYRLVRTPGPAARLKLKRIVHWQAERLGGQIARTTVCDDLTAFEVQLHDGREWLALTSRTVKRQETPAAFRIRFRRREDEAAVMRTYLLQAPETGQGRR